MRHNGSTTILHLITRLSLGGSASNTIDSAAAAARAGYRTILATGPSDGEVDIGELADGTGCRVETIPSLVRKPSPMRDLAALVHTFRLIRTEGADIVHTHTSKAGFIGRLAAFLAGVPVVIHTPHGHIFYGYHGKTLTTFFMLLERFAAHLTDYLVFLTEGEAREHRAHRIGRPEGHRTIPSGVDLERLRASAPSRSSARRQLGWPSESRVVLGVGRLVPIKGFDLLIKALPEMAKAEPNTRMVLVGDGPERSSLEELAAKLSVRERLTFAGACEDVSPYLAAADVLVAPSRNEGQGRVLVEAMSLGLPVVGTRVGGIPSVLKDGECGLLVHPESPGDIARAVVTLSKDGELRRQNRDKALQQAERFSLPVMESDLLALYRQAAAENAVQKNVAGEIFNP